MEKTQNLEIQVTRVQKDVSYLKDKMDKVENKLERMDEKTDKLMNELPIVFKEMMENYVSRKEFDNFVRECGESEGIHEGFDKRLRAIETKIAIGTAIFSIVVFLLSFGETISKWLTNLVHAN